MAVLEAGTERSGVLGKNADTQDVQRLTFVEEPALTSMGA
jgi:hypothetical protein